MNTNSGTTQSPHLLMWIAGIAVILFSVAGIAAIMGWIPTSLGHPADNTGISAPDKLSTNATKPDAAQIPVKPAHAARPVVPAHAAPPVVLANNARRVAQCHDCGVIESTREISHKGAGSGIGAVGGAVVGGLIGNQVGSGRGNTAATVIGAVGGAVGGNEIEKRVKANKSYEVTVRLDDGSSRVITEANAPAWRTGDHVKIVDGALQSNP